MSECDFTIHDRANVVHASAGRGRFAWAHRLPVRVELSAIMGNDYLTAEQIKYRIERRLSPIDLGWWESSGVARELALYDALSQVERWAQRATTR